MNSPILFCVITALFFGTWPLLARTTDFRGWLSFLVSSGTTFLVGAVVIASSYRTPPSSKALGIGIAAGILNGLGLLAYMKVLNWPGQDLSRLIPVISVLMTLVTALGAILLYKEPVTLNKVIGIALVCGAIYFLNLK